VCGVCVCGGGCGGGVGGGCVCVCVCEERRAGGLMKYLRYF